MNEEAIVLAFTRRTALALVPVGIATATIPANAKQHLRQEITDYLHSRKAVFVPNSFFVYEADLMPDFLVVKNRTAFMLNVEQSRDLRRLTFLVRTMRRLNANYAVVQSVEDVIKVGL